MSKAVWIIQVKTLPKIEEAILFRESLKRMRLKPYIEYRRSISETNIYRVRVYSTDESDYLLNAIILPPEPTMGIPYSFPFFCDLSRCLFLGQRR